MMMVFDWHGRLDRSFSALQGVVADVGPGDWVRESPCGHWNVAQVLDHVVRAQRLFASYVPGAVVPGELCDPFTPSASVDDREAQLHAAIEIAQQAWAHAPVDTAMMDTPLPDTRWPVWVAGGMVGLDVAVHAWDIAAATRQSSPIDDNWAQELMMVAAQTAPQFRQLGLLAPPVDITDDDQVSQLLAMLGRYRLWMPGPGPAEQRRRDRR